MNFRDVKNVVVVFLLWRFCLFIPQLLGKFFIEQRQGYIGVSPFANFDGVHYLSVAKNGYFQFEQAFFPVFPLLIRYLGQFLQDNYLLASLIIVHVSLFVALWLFFKLVRLDYSQSVALITIIFFLTFPTAFFLGSVYTESLFLALVFSSLYTSRTGHTFFASVLGGIASGTRVIGVFLIIPLLYDLWIAYNKRFSKAFIIHSWPILLVPFGLFGYMWYLWKAYGDPLLFAHSQVAFGAGRSGGEIILLPQVIWRYFKIFFTVPLSNSDWWLAGFELITFVGVLALLFVGFRKKVYYGYLLFSVVATLFPTLSGTFASIPRYVLVAFPVFIVLASIKKSVFRYGLIVVFSLSQIFLAAFFLQGYFIA